jgi:putative ABC transport system permease protein
MIPAPLEHLRHDVLLADVVLANVLDLDAGRGGQLLRPRADRIAQRLGKARVVEDPNALARETRSCLPRSTPAAMCPSPPLGRSRTALHAADSRIVQPAPAPSLTPPLSLGIQYLVLFGFGDAGLGWKETSHVKANFLQKSGKTVFMLAYYLRIAWKNMRGTPGISAVVVAEIALGICACLMTLTVYRRLSENPIWWKNNVLYAVTINTGAPGQPSNVRRTGTPSSQLSYPDATFLASSRIPQRTTIMAIAQGTLNGAPGQTIAVPVYTRVATAGFFRMFDVPFEYGGPWNAAADRGPRPTIVLSHRENDRLFAGRDSVGRTVLWDNRPFRIVGVLRHWDPTPRYYDMTVGDFARSDGAYIPFKWITTLHMFPNGQMQCWGHGRFSYEKLLGPNCVWIEMWAELPTRARREKYLNFVNAYVAQQRKAGLFHGPLDNHLWKVSQWLRVNHVVANSSKLLLHLAFVFLAVCLANGMAVLLAKFLRAAPIIGIRRALGASRHHIAAQHLVEAGLVSLAGSCLGLILAVGGLTAAHAMYSDTSDFYGKFSRFDPLSIVWALALAAVSAVVSGLYPAWRVGRIAPGDYLKSQ